MYDRSEDIPNTEAVPAEVAAFRATCCAILGIMAAAMILAIAILHA